MGFEARDYQVRLKDLIRYRLSCGEKRVMGWAMTGAGKGFSMSDFNEGALRNGLKILNVMRRREIIFQTVKNYKNYHGIKASSIIGNSAGFDPGNNCQVASIDTLDKRIKNPKFAFLKNYDLIVVDECHDLTSASYKRLIWFLEGYPDDLFDEKHFEEQKENFKKIYIGLTATPFRVGKKTHTFWQSVVKPIEAHELRDRGLLVPIRVYAPKKIDTTGIRLLNGDFDQKQLMERVSKFEVVGDVIETYKQFGKNKAAICFCINQKHSMIMAEAFRQAGIPAIHCDSNHSKEEREKAIAGLRSGLYKILTNCNIFSTGFDAPFIEVEVSCRPSESENLVVQQWGRVLRPFKICAKCSTEYGGDPFCYRCGSSDLSYEKKESILLDHGNNCQRWGLPYDIRQAELEPIDTAKKRSHRGLGVKDCPKCFAVVHSNEVFCICGYDFLKGKEANQEEQIYHTAGELHEVNAEFVKEQTYQKIKQRYNTYKRIEMLKSFKEDWKYFRLYEEFGQTFLDVGSDFGLTLAMKKKMEKGAIEDGIQMFNENFENQNYENSKVFK